MSFARGSSEGKRRGRSGPVPALLLVWLLAGAAAPGAGDDAPAVARLASELARAAAGVAPPARTVVGVGVESRGAPTLAAAVEARLVDELRAAGFLGAFPAPTREEAAADGADSHLLLVLELAGDLAASGELAPVRVNFFTGRPAGPGGLVSAAVPADREARLLARARPGARGAGAGFEAIRWAPLPAEPLALAAGDLDGDGGAEVAVLDPETIRVLDGSGAAVASLALDEAGGGTGAPVPTRDPPALLLVEDGILRWALPARGLAGSLRLEDGALVRADDGAAGGAVHRDMSPGAVRGGEGPAESAAGRAGSAGTGAPGDPAGGPPLLLAAGASGALAAPWRPGTNVFGPWLAASGREAAAPGPFYGAAAAPAPGPLAFAVVRSDGHLDLLGPDLAPWAPPVAGVGAAAALADLDGDGLAEAVVTAPVHALPDRVRILAPVAGAAPEVRFESDHLPALFLAAAAGDLDGDGRDEALLAGPAAGGGAAIWLVREADR